MTQRISSSTASAASTHRAAFHSTNAPLTAPGGSDGSVRPLLVTIATTLMVALALIVLVATNVDISAFDAGAVFAA